VYEWSGRDDEVPERRSQWVTRCSRQQYVPLTGICSLIGISAAIVPLTKKFQKLYQIHFSVNPLLEPSLVLAQLTVTRIKINEITTFEIT